jgi:hypothetical protein
MRPLLIALGLALLGLCSACSPTVVGAACRSDSNCPSDQRCRRGTCEVGTRGGTGSGTSGSNGSSGTSGCPATATQVDKGCPTLAATACSGIGDGLLDCELVEHCQIWRPFGDCADAGLRCVRGAASCSCPPAPGGNVVFVDARSASTTPAPSGAAAPAACAFHTIASAVVEVAGRDAGPGTVILEGGAIPRAWQPRHRYQPGDVVTPRVLDGYTYVVAAVSNGSISGDTEPAFAGGTINDSGISWSRGAPLTIQTYATEPGPTTFPAGVTVTSAECAADDAGPFACDPRGYLYASPGNLPAGEALLTLSDRDVLRGLTLTNGGSSNTGDALHCTDGGSIVLDRVDLNGSTALGARLNRGATLDGCTASISALTTQGFRGESVRINTFPGASVDIVGSTLGNFASPNGIGLDAMSGLVSVTDSEVFANKVGIRVGIASGLGAVNASLQNVRVTGNHQVGVEVGSFVPQTQSAPVSVSFDQVDIGRNNSLKSSGFGGLLFNAPVTLARADGIRAHDNGVAQIVFGPNATPPPFPDGGPGVWDLHHAGRDLTSNAVYCYIALGAKGVVDLVSTSPNAPQVDATVVYWDSPAPLVNVDYAESGPFGQIDVSQFLGAYDGGVGCPGPLRP